MTVRCLEDLTELEGARVLVRVDLDRVGEVSASTDDPRLLGVFMTVDWLIERRAVVALCTARHDVPGRSLAGIAESLEKVLGRPVEVLVDCLGDGVASRVAEQSPDRLLLLGNLAAEPGEAAGDLDFAARLAAPFTHFVNDAFGAAHVAAASVQAAARRFSGGRRAVGRAMQAESDALACLMSRPDRPNVVVLGGPSSPRRFAAALALVARADRFGAVGGFGIDLLAASGHAGVGAVADPRWRDDGARLLGTAAELQVTVVLPSDVRVGRSRRVEHVDRLKAGSRPVDMGPATLAAVGALVGDAETAFWCGATATDDRGEGSRGPDRAMARAFGSVPGFSVAAGLDIVERVGGLRRLRTLSHVVCGGESALAFIAGERLPGLAVMED